VLALPSGNLLAMLAFSQCGEMGI